MLRAIKVAIHYSRTPTKRGRQAHFVHVEGGVGSELSTLFAKSEASFISVRAKVLKKAREASACPKFVANCRNAEGRQRSDSLASFVSSRDFWRTAVQKRHEIFN